MLARGTDQRVEIVADGWRIVGPGVAGAEPTTEVVDRELAESRNRGHRLGERLDLENLRAHVHMQAPHPQSGTPLDANDQRLRVRRDEPELGSLVTREHVGVRVGRDAGDDPHQNVLRLTVRNRGLEPVDVV